MHVQGRHGWSLWSSQLPNAVIDSGRPSCEFFRQGWIGVRTDKQDPWLAAGRMDPRHDAIYHVDRLL